MVCDIGKAGQLFDCQDKNAVLKRHPHQYLQECGYLKGIGLAGFIGQDVFMGHVVQARDCVKIPEKHSFSYFEILVLAVTWYFRCGFQER